MTKGDLYMQNVILVISISIIFILGFSIIIMKKTNEKQEISATNIKEKINSSNEMSISIEELSALSTEDELILTEITNSKVLAQINNMIPDLMQAGNAAYNVVRANGPILYQAIIPTGAQLANSRDMPDAVRGIYHGANGIKGHANLKAVDQSKVVATNVAASVMSVASLIVGQYYMTQINTELTKIKDDISKIADFQNNEYKSKIVALIAQIEKIVSFQVEILENQQSRERNLGKLDNLEQKCMELLGQANLAIEGFAKKVNINFKQYEKEIIEAQNWHIYQKLLLEALYKISDLKYTLSFGTVSREECNALLPTYTKQVQDAEQQLVLWHDSITQKLGIDVATAMRKREGMGKVTYFLPGLFKEELRFCPISDKTVNMIKMQTSYNSKKQKVISANLFQKDVRLIAKGDKLYYLPPKEV